jgi:hypothetical protein
VIPPAFDTFVAVDWSGARGPYNGIAVAKCTRGRSAPELIAPQLNARWTRTEIAEWLCDQLKSKRRILIGMDFAFGFPFEEGVGYLRGDVGRQKTVFDLWRLIDESSGCDADFGCSTFTCDSRYASLFWKSGRRPQEWKDLKRRTELACAETTDTRPETVYKLLGSKQVGKASITGIRLLHHVRRTRKDEVCFWPFENPRGSTIAEIYPTLFRKSATGSLAKLRSVRDLNKALAVFGSEAMPRTTREPSDHETDALISAAGLRCLAVKGATWSHPELTSPQVQREGWIFGVS